MRWARCHVLDEYDEDSRRAIYVDDRVIVVSELAVTILDALPADEEMIGRVLVDTYGRPPGDLASVVDGALAELADIGLVNKTPTAR